MPVSQPMNPVYRGTVYPWQCDHMGHMNVMWYVGKFDEATWNAFSAIGLTRSYLRQTARGMAAVEQHLKYSRELLEGDVVRVDCTIAEYGEKSIKLRHSMYDDSDGTICATCLLIGIHIDLKLRKSIKFDDEISRKLDTLANPASVP